MSLLGEMGKTVTQASQHESLARLADNFQKSIEAYTQTAAEIGRLASSGDFNIAFIYAHPLMEVTGDLVMAWMLLWRAVAAVSRKDDKKMASFYDGQIKSAEYFIRTVLPVTLGKMESIRNCSDAAVSIKEDAFAS
jgi:hypothetical protein